MNSVFVLIDRKQISHYNIPTRTKSETLELNTEIKKRPKDRPLFGGADIAYLATCSGIFRIDRFGSGKILDVALL